MELTAEWCRDDDVMSEESSLEMGFFHFGILQKIFGKHVYDTYIDVEQGISSY